MWGPAARALVLAFGVLLASGCASSRSPLRLRILTQDLSLTPGGERPVEALLVNTGKTDLRLIEGAAPNYMVTCRRSIDPPGRWGLGFGSPIEGSVYGGITDRTPDPTDPHDCRYNPPKAFTLAAGESLPLTLLAAVPSRCEDDFGHVDGN
jgi:hypothetical protein